MPPQETTSIEALEEANRVMLDTLEMVLLYHPANTVMSLHIDVQNAVQAAIAKAKSLAP